jgi:hypothetical protein
MALAAPARAADEVLGELPAVTLGAYAGRLAWSEPDATTKRFHLVTRFAGVTSRVPVAPRSTPFDVDLGRGPGGATVAVYSRNGNVYWFDFAAGLERRVPAASKVKVTERFPAVSGEQIVFTRRAGRSVGLFSAPLRRSGPAVAVPGTKGDELADVDFDRGRIAFVRTRRPPDREGQEATLYLGDLRGGLKVVDRASSGLLSIAEILDPSFEGRYLYAAKVRRLSSGQQFLRYDLKTRRLALTRGRAGLLAAAFTHARVLWLHTGSAEGNDCTDDVDENPTPCELRLTDPLPFS